MIKQVLIELTKPVVKKTTPYFLACTIRWAANELAKKPTSDILSDKLAEIIAAGSLVAGGRYSALITDIISDARKKRTKPLLTYFRQIWQGGEATPGA